MNSEIPNVFVEVWTLFNRMEDSVKDLLKGTPAAKLNSTHLSVLNSLYKQDGQRANDRRAIQVFLTPEGMALKQPVQKALHDIHTAFAGFELHLQP